MVHYSNTTNMRKIELNLNISSEWNGDQLTLLVFATLIGNFDINQLAQLPEFAHQYFVFKNGYLPFAEINLHIINNDNYDDVKISITNADNNSVIGSDEETEKSYIYTLMIDLNNVTRVNIKITVNSATFWEKMIVLKGNYYRFTIDLSKQPQTAGISIAAIMAFLYISTATGISFLVMHYSTIGFMDTFPMIALGLGVPFFMFGAIPLWVLLLIGVVAGLYYFFARGRL